jgi:hypothetical protein
VLQFLRLATAQTEGLKGGFQEWVGGGMGGFKEWVDGGMGGRCVRYGWIGG